MNKLTATGITGGILIFLFPFIVSHRLFYAAINVKTFFIVWVMLIIGAFFVYSIFSSKNKISLNVFHQKSYVLWALLALLVSYLVSSIFGVNVEQSFFSDILRGTGVYFLVPLFLLAYMFSALLTKKDFSFIGKSVIWSSTLFSLSYFLTTYVFPGLKAVVTSPDLLFGNSTFAGAFILFGVGLTVLALSESYYKTKTFWVLVVALLVQVLNPIIINLEVLSGAHSLSGIFNNPLIVLGDAQASSATVFLIILYALGRSFIKNIIPVVKQKVALSVLSVVTGLLVIVPLVMVFIPDSMIQRKYVEHSSSARVIVWESAIQSIKERPFFGWGPENFDVAIQGHFDNRLFQKENLNEIWFDRAHNVFLDTLIDVGFIGLTIWLTLLFFMGRIFYLAQKQNLISENQAHFLIVILFANLLQLQTSFHVASTYLFLFILAGYALYFEKQILPPVEEYSLSVKKGIAVVLSVVMFFITYQLLMKEEPRQHSIVDAFSIKNEEIRKEKIIQALSRGSSFETLRLLSGSFIKGLLIQMGDGTLTAEGMELNKKELKLYEGYLKDYVANFPYHYRARVNLAYLYMLETILGDKKTDEAREILQGAYVLSPENPLTHQLEALSFLYSGNLIEAEKKSKEGIALNPNIEFSNKVLEHINKQKKTFPEITFMKLENL